MYNIIIQIYRANYKLRHKYTSLNTDAYLPYALQYPDCDEIASSQVCSHRCKQSEDHSSQDAEAQQPLGTIFACHVATWYLSENVAVKEGAQDPALSL